MKIAETREDAQFRQEARDWLAANVPRTRRPEDSLEAQRAFDVAWRRRQFDGGWGHIAWPEAYGGRGLPVERQLIWYEEAARAGAPDPIDMFFVALQHAGPTLIASGDDAQKTFYLKKILSGETIWCQGFSEPNAGSDLSALRTRGMVDGDHLVVTGQKIWTSFAKVARYQELLLRTDPNSQRNKGLTFVICDMQTPGIDVRPIRNLAGGDDFCEVFYDEARIPLTNVVGGLGNGWTVAMSTLSFERGTGSIPSAMDLARGVEELIDHVASKRGGRAALAASDSGMASRLAAARADVAALKAMVYMVIAAGHGGSEGSYVRLQMSLLAQRIAQIGMDILGAESLERGAFGGWPQRYLVAFKHTIAAGTSEIQRNTIGERILGLPKGPKPR